MSRIWLRKFDFCDIENKVNWINDPRNNTYLHYQLPLDAEKTRTWWESARLRTDRADFVIMEDDTPVGLTGVLGIKDGAGESYAMLHCDYTGRGIAMKAFSLLVCHARDVLSLEKLYCFVEKDNLPSQRMCERAGYTKGALHEKHLVYNGRDVDSYYFEITL